MFKFEKCFRFEKYSKAKQRKEKNRRAIKNVLGLPKRHLVPQTKSAYRSS
jgi:hypothetical protein